MITLDTIQALIDHKHRLRASCHACGQHMVLDLEALGQRLGFDHSTMHHALTPKLKCSRCGSKQIGLTLAPPTRSKAAGR